VLELRSAGALTTVQDGIGRPAAAGLGVPRAGAADPDGLAVANLLLGNEPTEAALELTLAGPDLLVVESCVVGLGGADLRATTGSGDALRPRRAYLLEAGTSVRFRGRRPDAGLRAYVAMPGGVDVPVVLGSRSTCLPGRFGGLDGRALRAGDLVRARAVDRSRGGAAWPAGSSTASRSPQVRVTRGPHADASVLADLVADPWTVSPTSDRTGVRLGGRRIAGDRGGIASLPMWWGAVQLPPNGEPIVLGVDAPTVGGYPVVAVVVSADRGVVGQLGPGDVVRFELVSEADARVAALERRRGLEESAGRIAVEPESAWDGLSRDAGAWPPGGGLDR